MSPTPSSAPVEEPPQDAVGIELGNHANLGFNVAEGGPQATPPSYSASPQPLQVAPISIIRENHVRITNIVLRSVALLFSFLAFVIMASDNHNYFKFNDSGEYSYCFSIALIASVYLALQLGRAIYEILTRRTYTFFYYIDFICDQILAYLLMSSASTAATFTNELVSIVGSSSTFTDTGAASVSMAFLCFLAVAASSVLSGYNFWKRTSLSL